MLIIIIFFLIFLLSHCFIIRFLTLYLDIFIHLCNFFSQKVFDEIESLYNHLDTYTFLDQINKLIMTHL